MTGTQPHSIYQKIISDLTRDVAPYDAWGELALCLAYDQEAQEEPVTSLLERALIATIDEVAATGMNEGVGVPRFRGQINYAARRLLFVNSNWTGVM